MEPNNLIRGLNFNIYHIIGYIAFNEDIIRNSVFYKEHVLVGRCYYYINGDGGGVLLIKNS